MKKDQLLEKPEIDPVFLTALKEILSRLKGEDLNWALTGSLAFALQGIPYRPQDIDIQTDGPSAYRFGELFSDCCETSVHKRSDNDLISSHFGRFMIKKVEVEVMGDMVKRDPSGDWERPVNLDSIKRWIDVEGISLPILTLSHEAESYRRMERPEKARVLADWAAR